MEISENFSGLNINMNPTFSSDSSNSSDIKEMPSVIKQPNEQMFKLLLSNAQKSPSNSPMDTPSHNLIHHQQSTIQQHHLKQPLKFPPQPMQPQPMQPQPMQQQIRPQQMQQPQMQQPQMQQPQMQQPQMQQPQMQQPQMQHHQMQQHQMQQPQMQQPQMQQPQMQQPQMQHHQMQHHQMKQPLCQNSKQGTPQTTILPPTQQMQQTQSGGQQNNNKKIVKFQDNGDVSNVNNDTNINQTDSVDEFIKISNYNIHKHTIYLVVALIIIGIILWYITNDKKEDEDENEKNKNKNKKITMRK
jgi:hypothetical protein